jgi:superfamily I DNA and/or RNA helicase
MLYNVQVNYLKSNLSYGAQVGTVDKFQGQEPEVVLIFMVTPVLMVCPAILMFLYCKNRLNAAISRARTLAVIVANPKILEIPCLTVDQLELVNMMCWVREYSKW